MSSDFGFELAGGLAIVIALVHGVLAETSVFPNVTAKEALKLMLRAVWQASTLAWLTFGVLLVTLPSLDPAQLRKAILLAAIANFAFAAVGNFLAAKGRHPGWIGLALVVGLIAWSM